MFLKFLANDVMVTCTSEALPKIAYNHESKTPSLTYLALVVLVQSDQWRQFSKSAKKDLICFVNYPSDLLALSKNRELFRLFWPYQKLSLLKYEFSQLKSAYLFSDADKENIANSTDIAKAIDDLHQIYKKMRLYSFDEQSILEWKPTIQFLVKWKIPPYQAFKQEIEAMLWAALWRNTVDEMGESDQYASISIEDPLLASVFNKSDDLTPEESKKKENCYLPRYYGNRFSPLCFTCGFIGKASALSFELLYSIGEEPWGHELCFWFMDCCEKNTYSDVEYKSMTKLLCEKGCVEPFLLHHHGDSTFKDLFLSPDPVFETFFQSFPQNCQKYLKFPNSDKKNLVYAAAWNSSKERLIYALDFMQEHQLLTADLFVAIPFDRINPENVGTLHEYLSNL